MFTTFSAMVIAIVLLSIVLHARRGYKKGLTAALIGLAVILLSASFSVLLSMTVANVFSDDIVAELAKAAAEDEAMATLMQYQDALLMAIKMVLSLLLYLPIFSILRGICLLLTWLIRVLCSEKYRKRRDPEYYKENEEHYVKRHRRIGLGVGALSGLLVAIILLTPLAGCLSATASALDFYTTVSGAELDENNEVLSSLDRYANDPTLPVLNVCGVRMLFGFATTARAHREYTNLNRELAIIQRTDFAVIERIIHTFDVKDGQESLPVADTQAMVAELCESLLLKMILADTLRAASSAWLRGETYLEMEKPVFVEHEALNDFMNQIFYAFSTTNYQTVEADIATLLELGDLLRRELAGVDVTSYVAMIDELMTGGLMNELRTILGKNPHMLNVSRAVDNLVMSMVSTELLDPDKYTEEEKEILFTDVADILISTQDRTGTVREEAVKESVRLSLEEYGIHVPDSLNEKIAKELINGVQSADGTSITADDVRTFFDNYLESNSLPEGFEGVFSDLAPGT